MAQWHHIQRDFSGGAISERMLMRADSEAYKKSTLAMNNYIPTLQGPAERAPGSRIVQEILDPLDGVPSTARIIPFLTIGNERSLIVMTPADAQTPDSGGLKLIENVGSIDPTISRSEVRVANTITYRKQVIRNGDIRQQLGPWTRSKNQYTSGGAVLGVWYSAGAINMIPRLYTSPGVDEEKVTIENATGVVDTATDVITVNYEIFYPNNSPIGGGFKLKLTVLDAADDTVFWTRELEGDVGQTWNGTINATLPTPGWTGTLKVRVEAEAIAVAGEKYSTPHFRVRRFEVFADAETTLTEADVTHNYTEDQLEELQFVQSPYGFPNGDKEIVFTHPSHHPARFYFDADDTAQYILEDIPFTNIPGWSPNNYPAVCTSYLGRLILAGGQSFESDLTPVNSVTETVWGTEVGFWDRFSEETGANPDDSIEFTTTYRSPIQWAFGHKTLLVGALEYEYIVSSDGIFSPGDLGVDVHSTNGGVNVQPAPIGEGVIFAADGGRKARMMMYQDESAGWVAPDLNLLNPDITFGGIRRMVRCRNPHQMCICLLLSGDIAIFHYESGVTGWSYYALEGGEIVDITVVADRLGVDVPYMVVRRKDRLWLESVPNWIDGGEWDYVSGGRTYNITDGSNILTGLEMHEGESIQVIADSQYLGSFKVSGGQVELIDELGEPYYPTLALAGQFHPCAMAILPPEKVDPGAQTRYSTFSVRAVGSTRMLINGERPSERRPATDMDRSEPVSGLEDLDILKTGWDPYQIIFIAETVPIRSAVYGVYGKLNSNSL